MKISKTFNGHNGLVNVGVHSFFVLMKKDGFDESIDDLAKQASHFNNVIINGDEPFEQKEELSTFIKKTIKDNPYVKFEIHTNGTIKPIGITSLDCITYMVNVQLKKSGIEIAKRINESVISWFDEVGAKFIFDIDDIEEVDEVEMIKNTYFIKKHQIYLSPTKPDLLDQILKISNLRKMNIAPKFREWLWAEEQI